jgi:hypothetical protein
MLSGLLTIFYCGSGIGGVNHRQLFVGANGGGGVAILGIVMWKKFSGRGVAEA